MEGKKRARLRALANGIDPCFQIGKGGINDNMLADISAALEAHELIKVAVLRNAAESPREFMHTLSSTLGAEEISVVGNKLVLYRRSTREDVAHIEI